MAAEMSTIEQVLYTIQEMAEILREEGDFLRADTLEHVRRPLSEVTSPEEQRQAARAVLSLFGGMGSFQDVSFNPRPGREGPRGRYLELQHQLHELATELLQIGATRRS